MGERGSGDLGIRGSGDLEGRFEELFTFLSKHRPLWSERSFVLPHLSWEEDHPRLVTWLRGLPLDAIKDYDANPRKLQRDAPAPLGEWADSALSLVEVTRLTGADVSVPRSGRLIKGVPARKLAQVEAFASVVASAVPAGMTVVDWCAGKGHLGRVLAGLLDHEVICLEHQESLGDTGARLDYNARVHCAHINLDVLRQQAREVLPGRAAVALHACGDLHRQLLIQGTDQGAEALLVAPCCYHHVVKERGAGSAERRSSESGYTSPLCEPPARHGHVPLSVPGKAQDLQLDQQALRLVTAQQAVARPRVIRMRTREQTWRLGLDMLLREATGQDRYWSVPPVPARWVRQPLAEFCRLVAEKYELELPDVDMDDLEQRAWRRLRHVHALGLVRGLFRRPLELWLVLDQALYLEQRGYGVKLGTFCAPKITPRNLLLIAAKQQSG